MAVGFVLSWVGLVVGRVFSQSVVRRWACWGSWGSGFRVLGVVGACMGQELLLEFRSIEASPTHTHDCPHIISSKFERSRRDRAMII